MIIKEILKEGNKRYFIAEGQEGNILFSMYEWGEPKTLEEIERAFLNADIPSYLKERYSLKQLLNEPLAIFELDIMTFKSELKPMNMSIWEYETFIRKDTKTPKALKMAFITKPRNEDYFYIACESYDSDSMVNSKNMNVVSKFVSSVKYELEKILNKSYSHIEAY